MGSCMSSCDITNCSNWSNFKYNNIVEYIESHCHYVQDLPQIKVLNCIGGILWIFEGSGEIWLTTKIGNEWTYTIEFVECLIKYVRTYQKCPWINSENGLQWINSENGLRWINSQDGYQWLNSDNGLHWINSQDGLQWLNSENGLQWINSKDGSQWLNSKNGTKWINSQDGSRWINSENGLQWINSENGLQWINSENGLHWINSENGLHWINSENGLQWINSKDGLQWINGINYKCNLDNLQFLNSNLGGIWMKHNICNFDLLDEQLKNKWITNYEYVICDAGSRTILEYINSKNGVEWVNSENGTEWMNSKNGTGWVISDNGHKWMNSENGTKWLNSENAPIWMNSENGTKWMKSESVKNWLSSKNGIKWKYSIIGYGDVLFEKMFRVMFYHTNFPDSIAISRCLNTYDEYSWFETHVGRHGFSNYRYDKHEWNNCLKWFQTDIGTEWLLTSTNGKKWLTTQHGIAFLMDCPTWIKKDCPKWIKKTNYAWYNYDFIFSILDPHNHYFNNEKNYICMSHCDDWCDLWDNFLLSDGGFDFVISEQFTKFLEDSKYMMLLYRIFGKFLLSDNGTKYLNSTSGKIFIRIVKIFVMSPHCMDWLCTEDGRYFSENNLIDRLINSNDFNNVCTGIVIQKHEIGYL